MTERESPCLTLRLGFDADQTQGLQTRFEPLDRQAHHVGYGTLDTRDDQLTPTLDTVSTGFVERIYDLEIAIDSGVEQGQERNPAGVVRGFLEVVRAANQRYAGVHGVPPAGKPVQHRARLAQISGLVQHDAVDRHRGIGAEHQSLRVLFRHRAGL